MIDAHESGAPAPVGFRQALGSFKIRTRNGSAGAGRRENRAQSAVKGGDARIEKTA
jgi:hypothetical protein